MSTFSYAFKNAIADGGATTLDSDASVTATAGDVLWLVVQSSDGSPVVPSGVALDPTGTPQAFTKIDDAGVYASFAYASLWRLVVTSEVTAVIRVTWDSSQGERVLGGIAHTGVNTGSPNGIVSKVVGTSGTTISAGAITTSTGNTVIQLVGAAHIFVGAVFAFNSPTGNERVDIKTGLPEEYDGAAVQDQVASGSSTTPTWTLPNSIDGWATFAFLVNDAGGGSSASLVPRNSNRMAPYLHF